MMKNWVVYDPLLPNRWGFHIYILTNNVYIQLLFSFNNIRNVNKNNNNDINNFKNWSLQSKLQYLSEDK